MKIKVTIVISPPPPVESPAPAAQVVPVAAPPPVRMTREPGMIYMTCDRCEWEGAYEDITSAKQGLAQHTKWCKKGHGRKKNLFG